MSRQLKMMAALRWLLVLPIVVAAIFNYPSVQLSVQKLLTGWTSTTPISVTLPQGTLLGKIMDHGPWPNPVEGFLGVPYALPPLGDLRFADPVAVESSNQTFEATEFGPRLVETVVRIHPLKY